MCLYCTVFEIARYWLKISDLNLPHLYLVPPLVVTPSEFHRDSWLQKTRVLGLSCGTVGVILRLAILVQYWHVIDGWTHDDGIYCVTLHSKNSSCYCTEKEKQLLIRLSS